MLFYLISFIRQTRSINKKAIILLWFLVTPMTYTITNESRLKITYQFNFRLYNLKNQSPQVRTWRCTWDMWWVELVLWNPDPPSMKKSCYRRTINIKTQIHLIRLERAWIKLNLSRQKTSEIRLFSLIFGHDVK